MAHAACDGELLLFLALIHLFILCRVRCDLKDLNYIAAGPTPSCSNCKERNIKCVYVILLSPPPRRPHPAYLGTNLQTSRPSNSFGVDVAYSRSSE